MGRKKLEPTKVITFRVPLSESERLKKEIKELIYNDYKLRKKGDS